MRISTACVTAGLLLLLAATAGAEEPVGNNLSYPAVYTSGPAGIFAWSPADGVSFLYEFSYGCDVPETVDQFSYPNTSCVLDDEVTYLTASQCVVGDAELPPYTPPCLGMLEEDLDLIYWQKEEDLIWEADTIALDPPVAASYLDWSDNLESNTWAVTSVIRIETQPFYQHPSYDPTLYVSAQEFCDLNPDLCMTGFQMWHASGHGPTEHWGVRVEPGDSAQPFLYESPFAIIYTSAARLNIAKLEKADKECPSPSGDPSDLPPDVSNLVWETVPDPQNPGQILYGSWRDGTGENHPCTFDDLEQTVELNVGGKWTYGYNWMTKRMDFDACEALGFEKEGWWRLTFYTEDGSVDFGDDGTYWADEKLAAPPLPEAFPQAVTESDAGDSLYAPEVLTTHDLTYIDICLTGKGGGGGGGGGGNGPPW